ncbi:MAG: undecaprenyl-diphosphate phosphatase [Bacteroidota bacterium]|nr:undecaprenyl-diphosphate phosphatase [Bacteroidota bacterium]
MGIFEAILLGVIQGLTEFLPVSSSGHLEIVKVIFNNSLTKESLLTTVVLHAATALSTIFVFRKDVIILFREVPKNSHFLLKIIISMIPAVLIGFFLESQIEAFFSGQLLLVGVMLIITGILLWFSDRVKNSTNELTFTNSLIIGIAQAIAILPGVSRSGATIATSILLGIDKKSSARFSFLMVIPLIFGVMIKKILAPEFCLEKEMLIPLIIGFISAFFTGIIACKWMIKLVQNSRLKYFAFYCFSVSGIIFISYLF